MMKREELLAIATRYLAYINDPIKYADDLPLILSEDAAIKISYPGMKPGCQGFKEFREMAYKENPEMTFTATQLLADEEQCCIAMLLKCTGTIAESFMGTPAKGNLEIYGASFLKIDPTTKMITERCVLMQELQAYQQLGAMPMK